MFTKVKKIISISGSIILGCSSFAYHAEPPRRAPRNILAQGMIIPRAQNPAPLVNDLTDLKSDLLTAFCGNNNNDRTQCLNFMHNAVRSCRNMNSMVSMINNAQNVPSATIMAVVFCLVNGAIGDNNMALFPQEVHRFIQRAVDIHDRYAPHHNMNAAIQDVWG